MTHSKPGSLRGRWSGKFFGIAPWIFQLVWAIGTPLPAGSHAGHSILLFLIQETNSHRIPVIDGTDAPWTEGEECRSAEDGVPGRTFV